VPIPRFVSRRPALLLAVLAIVSSPLAAQTPAPPPFRITVTQNTTSVTAGDGSLISYSADAIGRPSDASVSITHLGVIPPPTTNIPNPVATGTATITSYILSGSTDFSVTGIPDPSQTFAVNQGFAIDIRYKPSTSLAVQGSLKIFYTEQAPTPTNGVMPKPTLGSFTLNLSGVAPEFTFSYQPPPGNNTTPLQANNTILFPVTNVGTVAAPAISISTIVITNIGSGPGVVNAVTVSGASDFIPVNLPPPMTSVPSLKTLSFGVNYSPLQVETVTGSVRIDFIGSSITFGLAASSQGPVFAYDVLGATSATPVLPGQTITLPDTAVTAATPGTIVVRIRNVGNFDGHIASIDVSGTGFTLTQVPFTPLTLLAGASASVIVNFTPTQPGPVSGGLRIGTDTFVVTGTGLGPTLVYAYVAGGITTQVQNNGGVNFPPVSVGQTSNLVFQITNNGTAAGSVNSISVAAVLPPGSPAPPATATPIFALTKAPALPANIGAGETLSVTVSFTPNAVGSASGILRIDTLNFPVSGVANPPSPMPDYHFTGATGSQDSLQQISTGLSLASTYPLNLNGTLTLTFNSDVFSNDPAVQFAFGGRTVNFTIPAGSTQAVFPNNALQLGLQTGSVAGTITLTPSFITDGGINLTPAIPSSLNLTVAQTAPHLLSAQLSSKTANTFTFQITGYATGRAITEIDIQFTPTAGENVGTTKLSIPVGPSFTAWYQSSASQAFGSQFTVTIPLTLEGDLVTVTTLTAAVQTASVTLTNNQGVSNAQTVSLQ
jgi:hypothetical protein